jgi:hypothetical protein
MFLSILWVALDIVGQLYSLMYGVIDTLQEEMVIHAYLLHSLMAFG